ncbi:MAG: endonuclease/exonuclease/phosphatase family protein [Prosthecobacter sp.]|nr:endonuclease/exonuclease/phosphatase family protein [Prosthecobacter sp.]
MSSPFRRRTFGSAVLFACVLLSCGRAEDTAPVTFCAYNLKNWLSQKPLGAAEDAPLITKPEKEKARVLAFLQQIQPDILGVCEIGTAADLTEFQARLKAAGIDLPHTEFNHGGDPTRSLALLSRFPIVARNSQSRLDYQMGAAILPMQRGILDATLEIAPHFQVRLVGVHLKSKRAIPEADEALMRRNEAHLLRRHLDAILTKSPQTNIVCYGDFNEHRNEPAISEIIGSRASDTYMTDILLRDAAGLVWTHFWDAADVYSRFDYFFVSRALRPHVDTRQSHIFTAADFDDASDHRPIVLTLKNVPAAHPQ